VIVFTTPFATVDPPLRATSRVPEPAEIVKVAVTVSPVVKLVVFSGVNVAVIVAVPAPTTVTVEPEIERTLVFEDE
jgi:hypothetical protein